MFPLFVAEQLDSWLEKEVRERTYLGRLSKTISDECWRSKKDVPRWMDERSLVTVLPLGCRAQLVLYTLHQKLKQILLVVLRYAGVVDGVNGQATVELQRYNNECPFAQLQDRIT